MNGIAAEDVAWLGAFFANPNELTWPELSSGASDMADHVRPWLDLLASDPNSPIILPFVRSGRAAGWYATTATAQGSAELRAELNAWLGPSYLSLLEVMPRVTSNAMAAALRRRFGGSIYCFTGADATANGEIAARVMTYAKLLQRRPKLTPRRIRPVGYIRADFERAVVAGDEVRAQEMIAELRANGRLNEENLRYLNVRMNAGLGLWPQIARDHSLISTLSDLVLPPQVLADLIEALYRTYVDDVEAKGDPEHTLKTFDERIARRYPRLFGTRRGICTPRVVKSFLLFEQLQAVPNPTVISEAVALLPEQDVTRLIRIGTGTPPSPPSDKDNWALAEEAFEDSRYDRALAFFLDCPPNRKSLGRLLACASIIGTDEARMRVLNAIEKTPPHDLADLPEHMLAKIEALRCQPTLTIGSSTSSHTLPQWMTWAEQLRDGHNLPDLATTVLDAPTTWDIGPFKASEELCRRFADTLGSLSGDASLIARQAVPTIFESFFQGDDPPSPAMRPIADLLFLLIVMDEALSKTDLDLLSQLLSLELELGLSSDAYIERVRDLEDVQQRTGSYSNLAWGLNVSESLAISSCPSEQARDVRLRLFLQLLGQAQAYAHRLGPADLLPLEFLAQDYQVSQDAISALRRSKDEAASADQLPSLAGKTIGIYTLAETAGARAKAALEEMFPGCKVVVNSDLVCTAPLTSLAKEADMFVFAWKSSSHQAFYCVKDALVKGEPIWAAGKGTASILRAVLENLN